MVVGRGRVLVIEELGFWRVMAARALRAEGFTVFIKKSYNPETWSGGLVKLDRLKLDLIIVGCASIGDREGKLIEFLLDGHRKKTPLLVLSSNLSFDEMRMLFKKKVTDITDKPFDPNGIVQAVNQAMVAAPV